MAEPIKLTIEQIRQWIDLEIDEFHIEKFREKHNISPDSDNFYVSISRLVDDKTIKRVSRGVYRKVKRALPVRVFGRERRPPIKLNFPIDHTSGHELFFADDIIIREGDMILIAGQSNYGKTTLCMNICGENIDNSPVLMGNEYTTLDDEPTARFLNRLDDMDWVQWYDEDTADKFTLLPVRQDYAEHIVRDRINIIDWINLPGEYYMISPIMESIKRELGKGIAIIALQKNPGSEAGRGGNPSKDFADCELLLDQYGDNQVMLTIGKVKESTKRIMGRKFVYGIEKGVKLINFHEVIKCEKCRGHGKNFDKKCMDCNGTGYVDFEDWNHDIPFR